MILFLFYSNVANRNSKDIVHFYDTHEEYGVVCLVYVPTVTLPKKLL